MDPIVPLLVGVFFLNIAFIMHLLEHRRNDR